MAEWELQAHRRVLEQINEDRERVKSRSHHKVAKLNEHQTPTNSDNIQKTAQHKEKVEEREVSIGHIKMVKEALHSLLRCT